ncbi:MAG: hypothetical protein N4A54_04080 [Peptostreptococcaceae bacterium]|jgi:hypothetical protein|nr:hypothetical protein [Peptostreptococcaceae bacterium]
MKNLELPLYKKDSRNINDDKGWPIIELFVEENNEEPSDFIIKAVNNYDDLKNTLKLLISEVSLYEIKKDDKVITKDLRKKINELLNSLNE